MGSRVFGVAAMGFGVIALIWRDFATVWHPVPAEVPHRAMLVYVTAILLATLYLLAACLWLPRVIGYQSLRVREARSERV